MKTNVAIELTDQERDHVANLLAGTANKKLATRADINALTHEFWRRVLETNIGDAPTDLVGDVIEDINRGGWTLIGEPPGIE